MIKKLNTLQFSRICSNTGIQAIRQIIYQLLKVYFILLDQIKIFSVLHNRLLK
jgi:hypothetical protein